MRQGRVTLKVVEKQRTYKFVNKSDTMSLYLPKDLELIKQSFPLSFDKNISMVHRSSGCDV